MKKKTSLRKSVHSEVIQTSATANLIIARPCILPAVIEISESSQSSSLPPLIPSFSASWEFARAESWPRTAPIHTSGAHSSEAVAVESRPRNFFAPARSCRGEENFRDLLKIAASLTLARSHLPRRRSLDETFLKFFPGILVSRGILFKSGGGVSLFRGNGKSKCVNDSRARARKLYMCSALHYIYIGILLIGT